MDIQIYKKKYCIVIGVILLVLMGIGSIWDYQISQFFYTLFTKLYIDTVHLLF